MRSSHLANVRFRKMAVVLGRALHASSTGWAHLARLGESGWTVAVVAAFGGGVLVIARRNGREVRRSGESVSAIAVDVVAACRAQPRA